MSSSRSLPLTATRSIAVTIEIANKPTKATQLRLGDSDSDSDESWYIGSHIVTKHVSMSRHRRGKFAESAVALWRVTLTSLLTWQRTNDTERSPPNSMLHCARIVSSSANLFVDDSGRACLNCHQHFACPKRCVGRV